jgi:ATP-dependent Clp protease ATP-binding subunit ClpA
MLDKFLAGARLAGTALGRHDLHPAARQAVLAARNEASRAGERQIRSEHFLLGLMAVPGPAASTLEAGGIQLADVRRHMPTGAGAASAGLDSEALASIGIDLDTIRRATDAAFGPGALDRAARPRSERTTFADDAKQVIIGAVRSAETLGQRQISTGHLLLGALEQDHGGAVTVLTQAGADIPALRADVLSRIGPGPDAATG